MEADVTRAPNWRRLCIRRGQVVHGLPAGGGASAGRISVSEDVEVAKRDLGAVRRALKKLWLLRPGEASRPRRGADQLDNYTDPSASSLVRFFVNARHVKLP